MILTDLFESPEIHNQDRLDQVLARCIELIHEKNAANPKKYGRVAACIIDMKNRKVFGINSPGADGRRRHAERVAIDAYHKRYGKILPGAIIVTTLSPCNRDMLERDGPSCQDLLLQVGIEKVYSGYMDPSQHSEHPFTEETTKNDDLWRRCKEFSDSFVHDDLTEGKVKLYTDPGHYGAELDNYEATGPVVNIPADQLVGFEPDSKMQQPKSKANVEKIIAGIKQGDDIPPILVRKHKNGYQILDGHHRFRAYKLLGIKTIPAQVVPAEDIEEKGKQDVAEDTQLPGDFKLMGQNLFLKNLARNLKQRYPDATVKLSSDRVTAYHNEGDDEALSVMGTEVMDGGYIGVGLDDAFTESFQGVLVPTIKQTTEQLLAANPGMKPALFLSTDNWNPDAWTHIADKLGYRLVADDEELAEGQLTESAIFLNPNTVIVGQQHSQPLELSPETLKKVQAIAAQHGAWYEGNGADRAYTRGVIDRYVGSFDDEVAKTASPNDPKWIYVLFANVDANNRIQRVGVDPKDTIFNRLMDTAQDNSFQGIGFTASALKKFLSMASEGKYDFVKMSQLPATQENLTQFLKAGEALMWPSNWEQYPNRAGKIARAATVDTRDQYLATRKAGVYVVGAGHLKAVQDISGKQGVEENFADGKGPGRPGDSQRHGIPKHATMAELEKASHAKGRKGQLARWQLNMRRGHKK